MSWNNRDEDWKNVNSLFSDIFAAVADPVICEYSRFSSLFAARDVSPGGTSAPQQEKFRTDDVKSVRNLVRSSYIVYEWLTKDKRPQRSNVNVVNLLQNSQYSWNIFFFRKSIAVEHKTLTKSIRRNIKSNKFTFGTQWLPDLLCKHWFTSSVWNFCRWGADVPPYICWMQFFRINSDIQLLPTILHLDTFL